MSKYKRLRLHQRQLPEPARILNETDMALAQADAEYAEILETVKDHALVLARELHEISADHDEAILRREKKPGPSVSRVIVKRKNPDGIPLFDKCMSIRVKN